ncbi:MAG: DUF1990 family protein [Planctomycetaceae bacterium]
MYSLTRPTAAAIFQWKQGQLSRPVFPIGGRIPEPPPPGFRANRGSGCVGQGAATFNAAVDALLYWEMFPPDWVQVDAGGEPARLGQTVAVIARCWGVWTVNCCRVTFLQRSDRRQTLIYSTTDQHAVEGAEEFCVEHRPDDSVWFTIHAVARPRDAVVWLAFSKFRQLQRRFALESPATLRRAAEGRRISPDATAISTR